MTPKENLRAALSRQQPERVPVLITDAKMVRFPHERPNGTEGGKDWFGVDWTWLPGAPDQTPTPGIVLLESISDWKETVRFPDVDAHDYESFARADLEGVDRDQTAIALMVLNGHFERLHSLMGFENALMAFYDDPDALHEFFDAVTEHKLKTLTKAKEHYDPDVYMVHDDWGTNNNMFFSPELWREFIKPRVKRLIDHVHAMGGYYLQHSCGYVAPIVGDLVGIGCDACEIQGINDMAEMIRLHGGKITFMGGMDGQRITAPGCPIEEITEEIHKTIDLCAPSRAYIAYCIVMNNPELRATMGQIMYEHGKDFYR